jgi:hypothetical protein
MGRKLVGFRNGEMAPALRRRSVVIILLRTLATWKKVRYNNWPLVKQPPPAVPGCYTTHASLSNHKKAAIT